MTALLLAAAIGYPIQAGEYTGLVQATDDATMDREGYVPDGCPGVGQVVTFRFRYFEDLGQNANRAKNAAILSWEGLFWDGHQVHEKYHRDAGHPLINSGVDGFTGWGYQLDNGEWCSMWVWQSGLTKVYHRRVDVIGDANLDGVFDSADLVQVFRIGEYEDTKLGPTGWVNRQNSYWDSGDWNGDAEFTSSDLVHAMQFNSYSAAASAVPEPSGFLLVLTAGLFFIHRGRNR